MTCTTYPTIDGRFASDLCFDGHFLPDEALLGAEGSAGDVIENALDAAVAATAAEAVGVLQRIVDSTFDYCRQRRQFGDALSEQQVIQHRLVEMTMQLELARSAAILAALNLGTEPRTRQRAVSAAKVTTARACKFIVQNGIQLHGGIGMVDEMPLARFLKRATVIEGEFGSGAYHLGRLARIARVREDAT